MLQVRDAAAGDEPAWRALWDAYLHFYQVDVAEPVTTTTWRRILDPRAPMFARLVIGDAGPVGFSIALLHDGTWTVEPICYLEDLFVAPGHRSRGAGAALLQDLVDLGRTRGWARLYWHTQVGNAPARRLYDRFCAADDFVRYRLFLR